MFELTARWAGWSKNKGVVYFSASGAWAPGNCPESSDKIPYSNENWSEEKAGLAKWIPSKEDMKAERSKLNDYYKASPSASRFIRSWYHSKGYQGLGPHGFNVWQSNPKCKVVKNGKVVTGCNGRDAVQECSLKFMTKEAATYGLSHGAAHHPTRAFHMLRCYHMLTTLITIALVNILLDNLFLLKEERQYHGCTYSPLLMQSI